MTSSSVDFAATPIAGLKTNPAHSLWGGRFAATTSSGLSESPARALFDKLNRSLSVDIRLRQHDLVGSCAYARALKDCGILTQNDHDQIQRGIEELSKKTDDDLLASNLDDEDVHSLNERMLIEIVGPEVGGKLHTGRSRNEQIALDLKMWTIDAVVMLRELMQQMLKTFVQKARHFCEQRIIVPGFTHSQPAQPVALAHWLLSHAWPLARDARRLSRLHDDLRSACPLGSGALAGNPFNIDREQLVKALNFTNCTQNSMDAVSDRDFVVEFQFFASMLAIHLSRFAEDMITFSGPQFQFVSVDDVFCTGSSLMPQKRNPDALELLRAKPARFCGHLMDVLMMLKALPSCYNKGKADLQEEKRNLFDSYDQLALILPLVSQIVSSISANIQQCAEKLSADMLATDLTYFLVRHEGVAFRTAHHAAGRVVLFAEKHNKLLTELNVEEIVEAAGDKLVHLDNDADANQSGEKHGPRSKREILSELFRSFEQSVEQYSVLGGTAFVAIQQQINIFEREILDELC